MKYRRGWMNEISERYLDIVKKSLTNYFYHSPVSTHFSYEWLSGRYPRGISQTMIGIWRLDNIRDCVEDVLSRGIPGDLVETGVWRGGATIYMKAILEVHGSGRKVYVCDSFEGLPRPTAAQDAGDKHYRIKDLAVSLEEVKDNFRKYNLLDSNVVFLKGWFKDTLKDIPSPIAVLRLDGDMYSSTMDALVNLYPKLSIGGYLILDDYGDIPGCKKAVDDYRLAENITCEILKITGTNHGHVYWRKV
jgi:O-methyltransferase